MPLNANIDIIIAPIIIEEKLNGKYIKIYLMLNSVDGLGTVNSKIAILILFPSPPTSL